MVCAVAGCGQQGSKPTAHLSGTVTINGQPLPPDAEATIIFRPAGKGMAKSAGVRIVDSKYDSPQTPVGEVKVFFSIQQPTGKMISDAGGPPFQELRSIVPSGAENGISLTISGDNQAQDFDLN